MPPGRDGDTLREIGGELVFPYSSVSRPCAQERLLEGRISDVGDVAAQDAVRVRGESPR